ncbi:tRNA (adenosine(37)-N6)-threonylcarbamoyltransferase complex ATPase subunit type 1 TsaE [Aquiflexum sp.]|uniref:tRNA (adenosine(37)-N6)-threonylcarbamoyltransferase complex ATPase subunit type 1 TsaE n=1 Tax=Aquiflexum sp. TaxID=1872584 RepID=UPI003593969F
MKKNYTYRLEEIQDIAKMIVDFCGEEKIWVFKGDLGAGKTTLIKSIAKEMAIEDRVSSPTFALVNEYWNDNGRVFYHFDFYRVEDPAEVLEIGIEEYFYSGNYCWIEWAEKIPGFLPLDFILIAIEIQENGNRKVTLKQILNGNSNG